MALLNPLPSDQKMKILYNPFSNFKYRYAMHWRNSMNALIHPNKTICKGFTCYPQASLIYKSKQGLSKLIEICKENDKEYEKYLDKEIEENYNECIICKSNVNELCPYCKKVPLCNQCMINTDIGVNQLMQIHVNNCKTGIFE